MSRVSIYGQKRLKFGSLAEKLAISRLKLTYYGFKSWQKSALLFTKNLGTWLQITLKNLATKCPEWAFMAQKGWNWTLRLKNWLLSSIKIWSLCVQGKSSLAWSFRILSSVDMCCFVNSLSKLAGTLWWAICSIINCDLVAIWDRWNVSKVRSSSDFGAI